MNELLINISFPKDFSKESELISRLCSILHLIIGNANYISNAISIEKKATTSLGQQINDIFSPFISEVNILIYGKQTQKTQEEILKENQTITNPVNLRKLIVFYLAHLHQLYGVTQISLNNNVEEGVFQELDQKLPVLQKKIDKLRLNCENLSQIKIKYKGLEVFEKKVVKDLEECFNETETIKNDVKKSYQTNTREKANNDLMNKLNEYDQNIAFKRKIYKEGKELEKTVNEEMKKFMLLVFQTFHESILIFKSEFDNIIVVNQNQIKKVIQQTIKPFLQQIENLKIKKLNELKLYSFDKDFTLSNFNSSLIVNELLDEVQFIVSELIINRTILVSLVKRLSNVVQMIPETSNQFTKNIKGLQNPNLNISDPNAAIIMQMTDYLRSVFELFLKKFDEKAKGFSSSFINPIEIFVKELSNQESFLVSNQNKLTKEYSSFKINSVKLLNEKEALNNEYNQMKISFEQDPSILKKKESDFLSMKSDLEKLQNKMNDQFNKFKVILNDYYENMKKQIPVIIEKSNTMLNELKESICSRIQLESKTFNQIDEYFLYKQQINCTDDKIIKYIKSTFTIFSEENKLDLPKDYIEGLGKDLSLIKDISLINPEETIINNDIDLTTIIPENIIQEIRNNISSLKSNKKEMSVKNLTERRMHENIFSLDDDEKVIVSYTAALREKIILQGKLFLTNKKLVFFSWFNPSTLFGRTLIELPKEDITSIERKDNILFSNNLEVTTKGVIYMFYNIKHQSELYRRLRELCFNEVIETQSEDGRLSAYSQSPIRKDIDLLEDSDTNSKKNDEENVSEKQNNKLKKNYIEQIITYGTKQKKLFDQLYSREINSEYITNHPIGDVSLSEVFNTIYNPNASLSIFNNKSFMMAYNEKRQDYDIEITKKDTYENVPQYFYSNLEKDLIEMIKPNAKEEPPIEVIEYSSKCTHPILNKRLGGPSKLNVNEITNVYFVSPICLIAEVKSYMSGFMLMDCFVAILRYNYNSDIFYDQNHEMHFDTKLTITFSIEFLKETWFKSRITSEANNDNNQLIKETLLPLMEIVFKDILNHKEKGSTITRSNTWTQPAVSSVDILEDRMLKQQASKPVNQMKDKTKPLVISLKSNISNYLNVKNLPYKQRMIILFFILFLLLSILIKVFPIEYNVLIVLNIIGFGFVLFKLSQIEQMILNNNNKQHQQ